MKQFTYLFFLLLLAFLPDNIATAQQAPLKLFPNFAEFTFNNFAPFLEGGSIGDEYNSLVGRDIEREFAAGDRVEDVLQLGDIETLAPELFTLNNINDRSFEPNDFSLLNLSEFELVEEQTLKELVEAIPRLGEETPSQIPPIQALLEQYGLTEYSRVSLNSLINIPVIEEINLGMLEEDFAINSIPYLTDTELGNFADFESAIISEIPGLSSVPLSQFPNPISLAGTFIARIDLIWGGAESRRYRTISGSYLEGFNVPCEANCEYLELDDLENIGPAIQLPFEGKQWIAGREHWVKGGSGCLIGLEPTGIHPFGKIFKVVLWRTDETTDTAQIVLFFNFSTICGESPYIIGPIPFPFGSVRINDFIFIGTGG